MNLLAGGSDLGRVERWSRLDTPVHRLDPRAKIITTLLFIVAVISFPSHDVSALTPYLLYPGILLAQTRIPPSAFCRTLLLAAPFAVIVGLFNPFFDRQPIAVTASLSLAGGWFSFASILLRFTLTAGAALLLAGTTGMHRLCAGLEQLGLPRVLAVQLLFLHRYLFIVADEGFRMIRGVTLRTARPSALRPTVYASLVGHLLLRTLNRAEGIYRAMQARGFDGVIRTIAPPRAGCRDLVFIGVWAAYFAAARFWNLAALLGNLLTKGPS